MSHFNSNEKIQCTVRDHDEISTTDDGDAVDATATWGELFELSSNSTTFRWSSDCSPNSR